MKKTILFFLFLVAHCVFVQAQNCDASVPTVEFDFTGMPEGTIVAEDIIRNGQCCGAANNVNCARFLITLDPATSGINFFAPSSQGLGDTYIQFDCGTPMPVDPDGGVSICLPPEDDPTNLGPFEIIMCKPGSNPNTLGLESIPSPYVQPFAETCPNTTINLATASFDPSTFDFSNITSGTPQATNDIVYNTVTGDFVYTVPVGVSNTTLTYEVCGLPLVSENFDCQENALVTVCETFQISVLPTEVCCPDPLSSNLSIGVNGSTSFCAGGSVELTANNANGGSILWSTGESSTTITVNSSGNYNLSVTDAEGCEFTTAAGIDITVFPLPVAPTIDASGPTTICEGESVVLTVNTAVGNSVLWSNGQSTSSIQVSSSGTYSVTVTDDNGCSATSASMSVTVNPLPDAPSINADGSLTFCEGESVNLSIDNPNNWDVLWSTGQTTNSINVNTSGTYSVSLTDDNGCSSIAEDAVVNVTVNANPANPQIQADGPFAFCEGETLTLSVANSSGLDLMWSTGETTSSIVVSSIGDYSVTVTDANGCSTSSETIAVTVNPNPEMPIVVANGPTTFCAGQTAELTVDNANGNDILWSNGATVSSITVNNPGFYTATVSDANGCSSTSDATEVNVNPLPPTPTIGIDGDDAIICPYETLTLTSSSPSGNVWSTGETSQSIEVNEAGTYSVSVTDANGCSSAMASISVTVLPPDDPSCFSCTGALDTIQLCRQGALFGITDFPIDGDEVYTWYDENGNQIAQFTGYPYYSPTMAGTYTLVVTDPDYPDCFQVFGPRLVAEVNGCCELDEDCEREVLGEGSGVNN